MLSSLSRWEDKNSSSWKLRDSIMMKEMRAYQVIKHEATKKKMLSLLKLLVCYPMPKFHFPPTCLNSCLLSHFCHKVSKFFKFIFFFFLFNFPFLILVTNVNTWSSTHKKNYNNNNNNKKILVLEFRVNYGSLMD